MKDNVYTIDEKKTKKALKKLYRRTQFKQNMRKVGDWISENRDIVLVSAPALIGLTATGIKAVAGIVNGVTKQINIQSEKKVKDFYCYDRSLGHYWTLRRELSNREWLAIDERRKNGERMADILNDLHVLK